LGGALALVGGLVAIDGTSCNAAYDDVRTSGSPTGTVAAPEVPAQGESAQVPAELATTEPEVERSAPAPSGTSEQPATAVCPDGMVYVEGDYCMTVTHKCLESYAEKTATGSLGFDDQCFAFEPGSAQCGTAHKKVSVQLKMVPGDKHDQERADPKHAFGKKFLGAKPGDVINGCTVEKVLGYGRGVATAGSIVELDCPPVIHLAFCMDRYEYPNKPGATPARLHNWYEAQEACEAAGKRLCEEQEWTLACEGPEHLPYPNGWTRGIWTADTEESANGCNISRCYSNCPPEERDAQGRCTAYDPMLKRDSARPACYTEPDWVQTQMPGQSDATKKKYLEMVDHASGDPRYPFLLPSGSMSRCVSPYGIYDLTGNIDEWVQSFDYHDSKISNLKGGHYLHNCRARCRPVTTRHGPYYFQASIGFRCCADPVAP